MIIRKAFSTHIGSSRVNEFESFDKFNEFESFDKLYCHLKKFYMQIDLKSIILMKKILFYSENGRKEKRKKEEECDCVKQWLIFSIMNYLDGNPFCHLTNQWWSHPLQHVEALL